MNCDKSHVKIIGSVYAKHAEAFIFCIHIYKCDKSALFLCTILQMCLTDGALYHKIKSNPDYRRLL